MPPISVLIVDDHTLFRKGLSNLMQQQEEIRVVGEADTGREGVALAKSLRPDVILMDVKMPDCDGIQATLSIREAQPDARVIMLTVSEEDEDLFAAIKAGARGYLMKNVEPDRLIKAIHLVMRGEPVMTHSMASKLMDEFSSVAKRVDGPPKRSPLTRRETETLQRLAKGESNKEIAGALCISEHTVKIHLKNILKKLHMNNRIQAAIYAYQAGLIDQPHVSKPSAAH